MSENENSECDTNNKLLVRKTHEYEYQNSEPTLECQAQIDVYKMFISFLSKPNATQPNSTQL